MVIAGAIVHAVVSDMSSTACSDMQSVLNHERHVLLLLNHFEGAIQSFCHALHQVPKYFELIN